MTTSAMHTSRLSGLQIAIAGVIALAMIADGLDLQLLSLVAPVILAEWGVLRADFGAALSAAMIGVSVGASVGGWLGDKFGRKRVLFAAVLWFGLATIATSTADNVMQMTLIRVIGGIGFGAAAPVATALANEWVPALWRPRITSILTMGTPLGGMIGAATIPSVLPSLGWRGSFVFCGVISLVLAVLVLLVVRESPDFAPQSSKGGQGLVARVLARENLRLNVGIWLCYFCYSVVAYAIAAWAPVFLTMSGLTLPQALSAVVTFNFCAVIAAVSGGFLVAKTGSRLLIGVCSGLLLLALATLLYALTRGPEQAVALLPLIRLAFGVIGATTGTTLAMMATILAMGYPASYRSTGLGIGMTVGRLGGILIAFLGGAILSLRGDSVAPLFQLLIVATCIAFVAMLWIDRHIPRMRPE
jgi:MFS transporter, AAHS family, 4-hydroxybenzoate transporter